MFQRSGDKREADWPAESAVAYRPPEDGSKTPKPHEVIFVKNLKLKCYV